MTPVSGYPILLRGTRVQALVVGGGAVAERRVRALLDGGLPVCVVAPALTPGLVAMERDGVIVAHTREFAEGDVLGARLVVAATGSAAVNANVARLAREAGALVNLAGDPESSDFLTPAVHRTGPLVVAVSAGGVPGAAARLRDMIAERFGDSYGEAVRGLGELRRSLLDAGRRDRWKDASRSLLGSGFGASVEDGSLSREVDSWR